MTIGGIVAVIGPVLLVIGKIITAIGIVVSAIGTVITWIGSFIGVISTVVGVLGGPLTLAITAIIAIGVLLWKNWETVKTKAIELWKSLQNSFNNLKVGISNVWNGIKNTISNAWNGIVSTITSKASSIWNSITNTFNNIKSTVLNVVSAIKNAFNFQWQLPHIKLPHFSVSGSLNPINWLTQGVPRFSVSWYKKAYDEPVIFNTPTVIPTMNGFKGFGDGNGAEVVMSLSRLEKLVGANSGPTINMTVNGAVGQNVNELANIVIRKLTNQIERTNGRW